jgi:hypothetical protein
LGPVGNKILSLVTIWNFGKGTGLYWADIRLWGTKDLTIRPVCIRTVRGRTKVNQSIEGWSQLLNVTVSFAVTSQHQTTPKDDQIS